MHPDDPPDDPDVVADCGMSEENLKVEEVVKVVMKVEEVVKVVMKVEEVVKVVMKVEEVVKVVMKVFDYK